MGFTFCNLLLTHLPDYFLGGAWEHKTQEGLDRWEIVSPTGQIDVSLEKEEIDAAIDDGRAVR